jgi:hypothetical protein
MAEKPSHIKQLSLIHVCKIGLKVGDISAGLGTVGLFHLSVFDSLYLFSGIRGW